MALITDLGLIHMFSANQNAEIVACILLNRASKRFIYLLTPQGFIQLVLNKIAIFKFLTAKAGSGSFVFHK